MTESERQKASSEYYSELKKQLDELLKKDAELLKISEKIRNNKANFNDTAKYSEIVSNYLAKVLQENVGNISSPMGKEYVCKELLNAYYSTINDVLGKVQVSVDNQNNIHIRPQQAPFPAERVEQVAHSLEDATVPEEIIKRRSGSSVANVAKSFHDDFIKENADFRSKSGLKCYITRHSSGNCCKWCSSIAGKYSYKDAPHDVFRRHDNCNCTVTYENGRQRQNVWTKESWQVKGTSKKFQPVKLNRERAKAVQQENLQYKGVKNNNYSKESENIDILKNNDIISLEEISTFESNMKKLGFEKVTGFENFKGNVAILNEMYSDFLKLKNTFPEQFKKISINFGNQEIDEKAYAGYNTITGVFNFNPSIYNSISNLEKFYSDDVLKNYHPKGTTYRATVFHEFGHHIEKIANLNNKKIVKSLYNKFNNSYFNRKLGDEWIKKNISYYAAEGDYGELISESFAEYFESTKPRFLCIEIVNEVMKNL